MLRAALILPCVAYFAWLGTMALRRPYRLLAMFGVQVETPDGAGEIRAVYGGFPIAMAGALLLALLSREIGRAAPVAVAVAMGGMIAGRLASAALERAALGRLATVFLIIEIAVAGALLGAAALAGS